MLCFISSIIILNVIHIMILLCTYQYFHSIHCYSAFIAIDYMTSGTKCRSDATVDVEILKISRVILAKIEYFSLLLFHQLKISEYNVLFY